MSEPSHDAMCKAVVDGDVDQARSLAEGAVRSGVDLLRVVERGFAAGIREVGEKWEEGEYFLPELVQGAEAMKAAMAIIHPVLAANKAGVEPLGRVVIGTVEGDLHDIGKTLVGTLLEANGFEVHDLGADVGVGVFIERAAAVGANIVAASALLTTTMSVQRELAAAVRSDLGAGVTLMIGGSPTTTRWADEIGAVHADNAQRAVDAARKLAT